MSRLSDLQMSILGFAMQTVALVAVGAISVLYGWGAAVLAVVAVGAGVVGYGFVTIARTLRDLQAEQLIAQAEALTRKAAQR